MKALILAAGLGTRLRPITNTIPKPLVLIAGKPLMKYHLDRLYKYGITDVLINIHYLPELVQEFISQYKEINSGMNVTMVFEPELLGSAGTLKVNQDFFSDDNDFLIVYGDNLSNIDYDKIVHKHKRSGAVITVASYYEEEPESKGIIEYNDNHQITKFIEKPRPEQITSNWANAGIYVVGSEIWPLISQIDKPLLDFGKDVFPYLLERDQPMGLYFMDEYLLDIGTIEKYNQAQNDILHLMF